MALTFNWKFCQSLIGESVASFIFGFTVYSAIISSNLAEAQASQVIVGLAVGFCGIAIIYGLSDITISHFNPAITLSAIIFRKLPVIKGILYMLSQFIGFTLASAVILGCFKGDNGELLDLINFKPFDDTNYVETIFMEMILTGILTLVAFSVAINAFSKPKYENVDSEALSESDKKTDKSILAPLTIGLTLGFLALIGFASSGGVFNPGLVWGGVIFRIGTEDGWKYSWVYWVGEFAGAFLGAAVQVVFLSREF